MTSNSPTSSRHVRTLSPVYTPFCLRDRNRFLAEKADTLIAVYDGSAGGTRQTMDLALSLEKPVIVLDPVKLTLTYI